MQENSEWDEETQQEYYDYLDSVGLRTIPMEYETFEWFKKWATLQKQT